MPLSHPLTGGDEPHHPELCDSWKNRFNSLAVPFQHGSQRFIRKHAGVNQAHPRTHHVHPPPRDPWPSKWHDFLAQSLEEEAKNAIVFTLWKTMVHQTRPFHPPNGVAHGTGFVPPRRAARGGTRRWSKEKHAGGRGRGRRRFRVLEPGGHGRSRFRTQDVSRDGFGELGD